VDETRTLGVDLGRGTKAFLKRLGPLSGEEVLQLAVPARAGSNNPARFLLLLVPLGWLLLLGKADVTVGLTSQRLVLVYSSRFIFRNRVWSVPLSDLEAGVLLDRRQDLFGRPILVLRSADQVPWTRLFFKKRDRDKLEAIWSAALARSDAGPSPQHVATPSPVGTQYSVIIHDLRDVEPARVMKIIRSHVEDFPTERLATMPSTVADGIGFATAEPLRSDLMKAGVSVEMPENSLPPWGILSQPEDVPRPPWQESSKPGDGTS
jgi:hypothetical protein